MLEFTQLLNIVDMDRIGMLDNIPYKIIKSQYTDNEVRVDIKIEHNQYFVNWQFKVKGIYYKYNIMLDRTRDHSYYFDLYCDCWCNECKMMKNPRNNINCNVNCDHTCYCKK